MKSSLDEDDPFEIVADEFVSNLRSGQAKSITFYEKRYPEFAEQIRELFPTLLLMEKGKPQSKDSTPSFGYDPLHEHNISHLGDFEILHRIGQGGMGIVYEAIQKSLGRRVALKVLSPSMFSTQDSVARFQREARAAANLHHPHIVPIFNIGSERSIHYYAMQYIDGFGLDEIMAMDRQSPSCDTDDPVQAALTESLRQQSERLRGNWSTIAESVRQIASALAYAHSQNTWHRDIKPSNLLVDKNGKPWIADFGLAKLTNHVDNLSSPQQTMGTLRYMSVEQIEGEEDHRSDIYSLGLTLYELLTWQPAFTQSNRSHLIRRISHGLAKSPRQLNPQIPRDLETITLKATASDVKNRYQTATELATDLRRFLEDRPIMARRLMFHERVFRLMKRNPITALLSTAVLVLIIAVAIVSSAGFIQVQRALKEKASSEKLASGTLESIFDRFSVSSETDFGIQNDPVLSRDAAEMIVGLLKYYEVLSQQKSHDDKVLIKAADAQFHVAMIHKRLGNLREAVKPFESSAETFTQLSITDSEMMLRAIRANNELAVVHRLMGQRGEAAKRSFMAVRMLEGLLTSKSARKKIEETSLQFELAKTYYLMSRRDRPGMGPSSLPPPESSYFLHGLPKRELEDSAAITNQKQILNKAISLLEEPDGGTPADTKTQHLLAICLRERASDVISQRSVSEMEDELRSTTMLENLANEHPQISRYQIDLAQTYEELNIFGAAIAPDQVPFANEQLEKAAKIYDKLLIDRGGDTTLVSAAIHCYFKLALVLSRQPHRRGPPGQQEPIHRVEELLRKAIDLQKTLVKQNPNALGYKVWLSKFHLHLALTTFRRFGEDDAQEAIADAISIIEELPKDEIKDSKIVTDQLAACFVMQARIYHANQLDGEGAAASYAEELLTKLGVDPDAANELFRRPPPHRGPR